MGYIMPRLKGDDATKLSLDVRLACYDAWLLGILLRGIHPQEGLDTFKADLIQGTLHAYLKAICGAPAELWNYPAIRQMSGESSTSNRARSSRSTV